MANSITNKLFGTSISQKTQNLLRDRQKLASSPQPGESLESGEYLGDYQTYKDGSGNAGVGGMSSKTPFVRMWSAIEPVIKTETGDTFNLSNDSDASIKTVADAVKLEGDGKFVNGVKKVIEFGKVYELTKKENSSQIIMLGNNNYYDLLGDNNEFLRPQAGITGLQSSTSGNLGLLKKTEVSFKVFNFNEYQSIYQRYFLKPGALIFVDFGWNRVGMGDEWYPDTLYSPEELVNLEDPGLFLYGDPNADDNSDEQIGWVANTEGNVETVFGYVTNYDSKVNSDGSFDCKVEITSGNISLSGAVSKDVNSWIAEKIDELIDEFLINTGRKVPEGLATHFTHDYKITTPGYIWGEYVETKEGEDETEINKEWMNERFNTITAMSDGFTPREHNQLWGIHVHDQQSWIQIHTLEELILNPLFAFGQELEGSRFDGKPKSKVKFDSKDGCTFWTVEHKLSQIDNWVYKSDAKNIPLLFPQKRLPSHFRQVASYQSNPEYTDFVGGRKMDTSITDSMPIGQLFISLDIVKEAFNSTSPGKHGSLNVVQVYRNIISKLNEKLNWIDFRLVKNPEDDNIYQISDLNWITKENPDSLSDFGLSKEDKDSAVRLFEFDVTSQNSIVKNLDLSFKLPSDNIANMIAISGNSMGRGFSALNKLEDEAICTEIAHSFLSAGIIDGSSEIIEYYTDYKPSLGGDNTDSVLQKQKQIKSNFQNALHDVFEVAQTDLINSRNIPRIKISNSMIESALNETRKGDVITDGDESKKVINITLTDGDVMSEEPPHFSTFATKEQTEINNKLQSYMEKEGSAVSLDILDYWNKQLNNRVYNTLVPTALPMNLNLTIDGVCGLQFGQCFQINYLPKTYKNKVYFQIMKITHNLSSTGWETKLETQFRFNPEVKEVSTKIHRYLSHYLHSGFIQRTISDGMTRHAIPFHNLMKVRPETGLYFGAGEQHMSTVNQIRNYDGLYSFEALFATEDVEGYECKNNIPIVPDSIYDVLSDDAVDDDNDSDVTKEYSTFLYGTAIKKKQLWTGNSTRDGEAWVSDPGDSSTIDIESWYEFQKREKTKHVGHGSAAVASYYKWDDVFDQEKWLEAKDTIWKDGTYREKGQFYIDTETMIDNLTQYPNFITEDIDQKDPRRFIVAIKNTDLSYRSEWISYHGEVQDTDGQEYEEGKIQDFYDHYKLLAFYPGIPHGQRQLCVIYQGKMVWVPWDKFIEQDDEGKRMTMLSLHVFLMMDGNTPMRIIDTDKGTKNANNHSRYIGYNGYLKEAGPRYRDMWTGQPWQKAHIQKKEALATLEINNKNEFTCFVPGTKVTMYNNSLKNIEDIIVGDKVLSFNTSTSKFGVDEVVELPKTLGNYKKIKATYEDGTTNEFSPAHPFYIEGKGWSSYDLKDKLITGEEEGAPTWSTMDLKQLEVGDYCINNLNKKIKIVSLEETNEYVDMYNLEHLDNNRNWFANGILVKE